MVVLHKTAYFVEFSKVVEMLRVLLLLDDLVVNYFLMLTGEKNDLSFMTVMCLRGNAKVTKLFGMRADYQSCFNTNSAVLVISSHDPWLSFN